MANLMGSAAKLWLIAVVVVFLGVAAGLVNLHILTWTQQRVESAVRGCVMSVFVAGAVGLMPVSLAIGGMFAQWNLRCMFVTAGSTAVLTAAASARLKFLRRLAWPASEGSHLATKACQLMPDFVSRTRASEMCSGLFTPTEALLFSKLTKIGLFISVRDSGQSNATRCGHALLSLSFEIAGREAMRCVEEVSLEDATHPEMPKVLVQFAPHSQ